jgi:hypothetical protein
VRARLNRAAWRIKTQAEDPVIAAFERSIPTVTHVKAHARPGLGMALARRQARNVALLSYRWETHARRA